MGRRRKNKPIKLKIEADTGHSIVAVFFMLLALLIIVSFTGQGVVLQRINGFLSDKLGLAMLFLPLVSFSCGLVMLRAKWRWAKPNVLLGLLVMMAAFSVAFRTGEIGAQTFVNLERLLSPIGTYITTGGLIIVGLLITLQSSLVDLIDNCQKIIEQIKENQLIAKVEKQKRKLSFAPKISLGKKEKSLKMSSSAKLQEKIGDDQTGTAVVSGQAKPSAESSAKTDQDELDQEDLITPSNLPLVWDYPPLSLLSDKEGGEADRGDVNQNADIIENTLESFGINAHVKEVNFGPSVTQYALQVSKGTKLSRITSLSTDLAMALAAPTGQVRIEAPIAGRSLVGIEVPNRSFEFVTLKEILGSSKLKKHPSKLAVGLGIDVSGNPIIENIAQMPHLLIAGATGSGKSICINNFLCSLLFRASPSELQLILVDPKRVELSQYDGIPHLKTPVIVEPKKIISALKWTENQMEKRYKKLQEVGVRDIRAYNELAGLAAMPNLIIVVDEMADIMAFAPGDVEASITRIAQMARAVGIHLVLSTQRPSVDVITGLIKANIPARIAFNVNSLTDSRVILDSSGAEKLLGKGDMLYQAPDRAKPVRIQGTFVSPKEASALIDYLKSQGQRPDYEQEIVDKYEVTKSGVLKDGDERDELFDDAIQVFAKRGKASASLLQRRLSIGYNRAARILDQLFDAGLIGPPEGSKARKINEPQIKSYLEKLNLD